MDEDPTDDIESEVEEVDSRIDKQTELLADTVASVASDVTEAKDSIRDLEEKGATEEQIRELTEKVEERFDTVQEDVSVVGESVEDIGEEVEKQGERTREELGSVSSEVEEVGESVNEVGGDVEDVAGSVDEVGDDVEGVAEDLSELENGLLQDLLDEKDERRREVVERMEQLYELADKEYTESQLDTILETLARKDLKHNNDVMAVIGHLFSEQDDGRFDHAAYQNVVGSNAQAYGIEDVDGLDLNNPQVVRNIRSFYGEEDAEFNVLSDPLQGMNAWDDDVGYGNVLRHTWTRIVDETADYMAEMEAMGAEIDSEVQETVLEYLGEAGSKIEETADEAVQGSYPARNLSDQGRRGDVSSPDREISALLYLDKEASRIDSHLQAGEYEEAVNTLEEAYSQEEFQDILQGEVEVGA
ncbi:MAG: hypothetical protein ABEJ83_04555 [Candidatus Nanohaloarchaea archaeon]